MRLSRREREGVDWNGERRKLRSGMGGVGRTSFWAFGGAGESGSIDGPTLGKEGRTDFLLLLGEGDQLVARGEP